MISITHCNNCVSEDKKLLKSKIDKGIKYNLYFCKHSYYNFLILKDGKVEDSFQFELDRCPEKEKLISLVNKGGIYKDFYDIILSTLGMILLER